MLYIPPTNCLLLTAKQEPYKKAYLLTKNIEEFSGKKRDKEKALRERETDRQRERDKERERDRETENG